jgi:hypothetical protein
MNVFYKNISNVKVGGDESVWWEGLSGLPAPHHVPQVLRRLLLISPTQLYTDKKENQIFLIYKDSEWSSC